MVSNDKGKPLPNKLEYSVNVGCRFTYNGEWYSAGDPIIMDPSDAENFLKQELIVVSKQEKVKGL